MSNFFALMARLKYIRRWGLMRSTRDENIQEHSLQTAMIAHMLALIGNKLYGKNYNADSIAVILASKVPNIALVTLGEEVFKVFSAIFAPYF